MRGKGDAKPMDRGSDSMSTKKTNPEMDRFNAALSQVLKVSKTDLNRLLAEDRASKADQLKPGRKSKSSVSALASHGSD